MPSNLKTLLPQYNPKEVEDKIYRQWEKSGFFNPDKLPTSYKLQTTSYCITIPPPNITGSLHMGHALNAVIQDILIRKKRMEGYKTLWLPGTDHAGIATQNVVEKELKKEGLTRHDIGREKLIERIWQWKEKYGHIILDQFKKLGSSMDWSRTRFTMDGEYQETVKTAFLHYYKKGWIYQAERVINWCIRCATSLSDLELEYKEIKGTLYYINYPIADGSGVITVATTRPETMLGDTAVAVNPKDERYKKFIGKKIILPIQKREIPIIADRAVDIEFGTGAVKVTPAHDILDAEIGERHDLSTLKVIGPDGKMTKDAGTVCEGLKAVECRTKIIEELKKQNFLEREEPYIHNVAICYRCAATIEPIPSLQWFLKMDVLAKKAIQAVKSGKVKFHPKRWEKVYFDWLKNIRDWCISRQIWWGHQLPVFYCNKKPEEFPISNFQFPNTNEYIVTTKKPTQCPFCKNCRMKQIPDVLDTWFSAALWPFATLGWPAYAKALTGKPQKSEDFKTFYPTQMLSTARDIINLWVARMIFSGIEFAGKEPFKTVIIHATILTKEGKRMSKSLGTGIDPMDLISRYGADATRFGLIWQAMGNQDIHWSEEHVIAGRKFTNKVWNASRFVLLQFQISKIRLLDEFPGFARRKQIHLLPTQFPKKLQPKTIGDKKILAALAKIQKEVSRHIDRYEFGQALHTLYDFFWHTFCDKYLETAKSQITNNKLQNTTREILLYVLIDSLKLLHPFMPFVTEEIWSHLPLKDKKMLIIESWPK